METYIVDAERAPWREGETEGLTFRAQVLLDGLDGRPEALRFRFDPCPSVYAHMHLTSQFQLVLGGGMDMPRGRLQLARHDVHYTDHNVPYGPFAVRPPHDMLVLHPQPGGLVPMQEPRARREINLDGRLVVGCAADHEWRPVDHETELKVLIASEAGPSAVLLKVGAGRPIAVAAAPFGRYEIVLEGSARVDSVDLVPPGLRFVRGDELPVPLTAGPGGATVAFLAFDADALAGALGGEGLAVEAAAALAKAI